MYSRAAAPSGTGSRMALGKKNLSSLAADAGESLPCVAFCVPSVPKRARSECGELSLAVCVLVGPMSERQSLIASVFARHSATIGPPLMNSTSPGKKCFPRCSA